MQKLLKKIMKDKEQRAIINQFLAGFSLSKDTFDIKKEHLTYHNKNSLLTIRKDESGNLCLIKIVGGVNPVLYTKLTFLKDNHVNIETYEQRTKGIIYTESELFYSITSQGLKEQQLNSCRYSYSNTKLQQLFKTDLNSLNITDILFLFKKYEQIGFIQFEYDMQTKLIAEVEEVLKPLKVLINDTDKSPIFEGIYGSNRLLRLINLYHGTVTQNIFPDLMNIHNCKLDERAYSFHELRFGDQENKVVGEKVLNRDNQEQMLLNDFFLQNLHLKCPDLNTRNIIIKYLLFQPTAAQIAQREIELKIGMPYYEYASLPREEQEKINKKAHGPHLKLTKKETNKYLYKVE